MTKQRKANYPVADDKCPRCGQVGLDYDDQQLEEDHVRKDWTCPKCKTQGVAWYNLLFSSHAAAKPGAQGYDYLDKTEYTDDDTVVIQVKGGCASVDSKPDGIKVRVNDLD